MREKNKRNFERKENVLLLIAYASLKNAGEPTDPDNIQAERYRLERVAESYYKSAPDKEYNEWMVDWLQANAHEIVYTDRFVYDVPVPDEPYELNVDLFCRKPVIV